MKMKRWVVAGAVVSLLFTGFAVSEEFKGRILGEKCAQEGKIGECYLQWAEPMVLWTDDGDYYRIELGGKPQAQAAEDECMLENSCWEGTALEQATLDKGFGQEVRVEGKRIGADRIQLARVTLLNPPGKKEFFKG
jgi:hypothetical protein